MLLNVYVWPAVEWRKDGAMEKLENRGERNADRKTRIGWKTENKSVRSKLETVGDWKMRRVNK